MDKDVKPIRSVKNRQLGGAVVVLLWLLMPGCQVWQHESHLEGLSAEGLPQTRSNYWIHVLSVNSLTSAKTWEKCLSVYEQKMPAVFSRNGHPVFIELESDFHSSSKVGMYWLNGLLSVCTVFVIPLCEENDRTRYRVHVSLDERQRNVKTFTVVGSIRRWNGLLAAAAPMPEVVDSRFVHARSDGGFCRQEYADVLGTDQGDAYLYESWNGEADAIVQGVACILKQFEEEQQRRAVKSRKIGD